MPLPISARDLAVLARELARAFPAVRLCACTPVGGPAGGMPPPGVPPAALAAAVADALRFGEAVVSAAAGCFLWAVPLLHNARLDGGLVAWTAETALFPHGSGPPAFPVRAACAALLAAAERGDHTNQALLAQHRAAHQREGERAEFLRQLKRSGLAGVAGAYFGEEAELTDALRAGDRGRARAAVNRLLVGIYHHAGSDPVRVRSQLLELVVLLRRTAAEAGARRESLPAGGELDELATCHDDEALTRWLVRALERLFDAIEQGAGGPDEAALRRALRHINEHCTGKLPREAVAEAAGVPPERLSRLLAGTGLGLTELINRARIDRARALLERGGSALEVALAVGFPDPSYFTKVFRRHTGQSPRDYRARFGG
jgi:AraC-like DNA-binding protein